MLKKPYSLSLHLVLLVLAAMIPFFVFSSILVHRFVTNDRETTERRLIGEAKDLAAVFDQEIEASFATLNALAAASKIEEGDVKGFYQDLTRVVLSQPFWTAVNLHDSKGDMLFTTLRPLGTKIETSDVATVRHVLETGRPVVGDLAKKQPGAPYDSHYAFAIRVPVKDAKGKTNFVLSAIVETARIQALIDRTGHDTIGRVRALSDQQARIGGRSVEPEKYVGKIGTTILADRNGSNLVFGQGTSIDGSQIYRARFTSALTGWRAGVAVPIEFIDAPARRATMTLTLVGFSLFLVFGALAIAYSRYLAHKIQSAASAAFDVAQGRKPTVDESRVLEVENLRTSLMDASQLLQRREAERNMHLHEAEKANRAKSEFLANMSHELRTPLGVVLGITELLAEGLIPPDERERNIEAIRRNGQQLLRLIDDILDLSKVEASKLTFESVEFSFTDLVSSVLTDFRPIAMAKGIELTSIIEPGVPNYVKSDPVRIRQIIHNIVGNAVKFTAQGQVSIDVRAKDTLIDILVSDTGIGIEPHQQEKLFNVFTQADSGHTRKFGGTGLGLSLSRKLAQLLGGDLVLVASEPGRGSTFRITFQVELVTKAEVSADGHLPANHHVWQDMSKFKILLADDSHDNVMLIKSYLKSTHAKVDIAHNGLEALDQAGKSDYDLVIMDIQMPEMDGYQATEELRRRGFKPPIIALTAHALNEHRDRAFAAGYTDFVTKPVRRADLIEAVSRNLEL